MVTASGAGCDMGPWMRERVLEARSVGTAEVRVDTCAGRARGAADADGRGPSGRLTQGVTAASATHEPGRNIQ